MPSSLWTRPFARPAKLLIATLLAFSLPALADNSLNDIQKMMRAGQMPQALERVDTYIAGRPKDAQGRFLKGLILAEMNRANDAIAVFTKLTEDYPELPEPYNNLAVLYAQQKQYDKARNALEMAIRTHPSYAVAYENLGDIYAKLASHAYDKALQLDSSNAGAQGKLALIRDLISPTGKPGAASKPAVVAAAPAARAPEPVKVAPPPAPVVAAPVAIKPPPPPPPSVAPAPAAAPAPAVSTASVAPPPLITARAPDKPAAPVIERKAVAPQAEPAPEAAPQKASHSAAEAEVLSAVNTWADAWSSKDVRGYLASYASSFHTPNGMPRKEWEDERRQRIDKPGTIRVSMENVVIEVDGQKAKAHFRQHYRSANIKSSTSKTLIMIRSGGRWQIEQELLG